MVFCKGGGKCKHFDKESAEKAVSRIYYTTKDGAEHHGPHWSLEQVLEATKGLQFKPCVTDYDKYVAFNAAYADLCKTLTPDLIIETGHAFFSKTKMRPATRYGGIWRVLNKQKKRDRVSATLFLSLVY